MNCNPFPELKCGEFTYQCTVFSFFSLARFSQPRKAARMSWRRIVEKDTWRRCLDLNCEGFQSDWNKNSALNCHQKYIGWEVGIYFNFIWISNTSCVALWSCGLRFRIASYPGLQWHVCVSVWIFGQSHRWMSPTRLFGWELASAVSTRSFQDAWRLPAITVYGEFKTWLWWPAGPFGNDFFVLSTWSVVKIKAALIVCSAASKVLSSGPSNFGNPRQHNGGHLRKRHGRSIPTY